jgi:hypothetical protein
MIDRRIISVLLKDSSGTERNVQWKRWVEKWPENKMTLKDHFCAVTRQTINDHGKCFGAGIILPSVLVVFSLPMEFGDKDGRKMAYVC